MEKNSDGGENEKTNNFININSQNNQKSTKIEENNENKIKEKIEKTNEIKIEINKTTNNKKYCDTTKLIALLLASKE